ncbi:Mu transposase C-terminal domain-containing protein [Agrobacterium rosae]|uniref:Mu transposase C-terminal domain-containing protein n=1 Tax=Agrobacterium rosae TaxID=1972867 RepID=A0AAW9FR08_9HYPH|nr:Mu transposase C-terminal domain-containing protein [Agrobacterium rosae]MDX8306022.1 Mu transposase C-terminal domain-containing protein [Agrobacterium rosae]
MSAKKEAPRPDVPDVATRLSLLRPYLDGERPLKSVAAEMGISLRTARRWIKRLRDKGPVGLVRKSRSDAGHRKLSDDLLAMVEGLALTKPKLSIATIHRRVRSIADARGWRPPSYASIHMIVKALDPATVMLAHEGEAAFRDRYELVHLHRAERPNATWQADHTQLDLIILDANGTQSRPWLTTVIDDYSRAVAGYMVFIGAPSSLNTSLALRQAIWRKANTDWPVCGVPDVLHVDHGSDFTSIHLDQVAADLRFRLVYSIVARPQGRGKVERLFGTINTELLPELPGHLVEGKPVSPPGLSLSELNAAIGAFIVGNYNKRVHGTIGEAPIDAWRADGWLPRLPENLEALDMLLVMVAKPRVVRRDGIHFEGLRFLDPTLASYVGESVTIRYDPRDMGEVRVFHRNRFLCRAVNVERAGQAVSLKDIQTARSAHRRQLRGLIKERQQRVVDLLLPSPRPATVVAVPKIAPPPSPNRPRLRTYVEDD